MPFGLKNVPATFQRIMENRGLEGNICFVYLDEIIIFGWTKAEHLEWLEQVLDRLAMLGLKIKLTKCSSYRMKLNTWVI